MTPQAVPKPRYRHSSCVVGTSMFTFGGINEKQIKFNDMFEYQFRKGEWRQVKLSPKSLPSARTFHTLCSKEDDIYLFGGSSTEKLNDFYYISIPKVTNSGGKNLSNVSKRTSSFTFS